MHDLARIFGEVKTPAYVLDVAALKRNLKVIEELRAKTGIKILLATKAFSMFSAFPLLQDYFDGTTASGFYEARLGAEHFGKEVHVYSPAYTDTEMADLLPIADDVYFNSNSQLQKFLPMIHESGRGIKIGLRVNPEFSSVKHEIYNPCSPNSRFGVVKDKLAEIDFSNIDILHFHALCENMAEDSVALIEHVSEVFSDYISKVKAVNFGGGHYITHPDYDLPKLLAALNKFRKKFDVEVILEPGGAVVYNSGYLLASVVDITQNQKQIAILDISATCHMPDVLEMPYRPNIIGAGQA
ncbi:MAG: carboxynorspermidine decarboxylase, partial [Alphaproteobacteria bacterium CG11_big_fil_rev_8_21_14_0_20_44_7]